MFVSYKSGRGFVTNSNCKDQMITPPRLRIEVTTI